MCTVVTYKNNNIAIATARNMDWKESMHSKLWVLPRGLEHVGHKKDPNSLVWKSKYGSVVTSCYDAASADGMNEKGLSAHMLWLAESEYPSTETVQKGVFSTLSVSYWAQYFLDNCVDVNDALEQVKQHPFHLIGSKIPGTNMNVTVHLALVDGTGNMAIMEYIKGALHVWHSKKYAVMTNSPTFDKQLINSKKYDGFGGKKPLPGSTEADDRFVRTQYYLERLQKPRDLRGVIAGVVSVARSAAQPYSRPDPSRPNISPTIWRTVCDHTNKVYYFEATDSPYLVWLDMKKIDFSKTTSVRSLNLDTKNTYIGESSAKLGKTSLFKFANE